ncbi:MAG: Nucleolar protein 58 [Marteilia pararefringens]
MIALYDTASGLAVVELLDKTLQQCEDLQKAFQTNPPESLLKLRDFLPYESTKDSLKQIQKLRDGKMMKTLKKSLKSSLNSYVDSSGDSKDKNSLQFASADSKFAKCFSKQLKVPCLSDDISRELLRKVAQHYPAIAPEQSKAMQYAQIGLAFRMARNELQLSADKLDKMVIQAITLLESVIKEVNTYTMKITEWYGWHFPELKQVISNTLNYVAIVAKIGKRENFSMMEASKKELLIEILKNDNEDSLKSPEDILESLVMLADTSIGLPLDDYDYESLHSLCIQTLELEEYRVQLSAYLNNRMKQICPNLSLVLGDLVAAKLLAHAGSLSALSKKAASTLQILGAEKALFRAIKTRSNTPKYGIMFNNSLVQQASAQNRGKLCRSIASKAVLAARIDYNQKGNDSSFGQKFREQMEKRAKKVSELTPKTHKPKSMQQRPKQFNNNFAKRSHHDSKFDMAKPSNAKYSKFS